MVSVELLAWVGRRSFEDESLSVGIAQKSEHFVSFLEREKRLDVELPLKISCENHPN